MSWLRDYIGKPWRADAEGPEAYDCKGLVRAVQTRVWGRDVPALLHPARLATWAAVRASAEHDGWRPVQDKPAEGDIVVLRGKDGPHVGVFVRAQRRLQVLHAHGGGAVRLNLLADLLVGGYSRPEVWRCN
jgi:cell wall-associated NlpC family hydrolase